MLLGSPNNIWHSAERAQNAVGSPLQHLPQWGTCTKCCWEIPTTFATVGKVRKMLLGNPNNICHSAERAQNVVGDS